MSDNLHPSDCVTFKDVQKSYPPGEHLSVLYELHKDYISASRDWVGLFQVGWTSSRDYYTFEWAPTPENLKGVVRFAGRRLPPEDTHFYQFCYVSSNGRVRGASPPFQFTSASLLKHNIEDLELVEVSEDSLMVLQRKSSPSGGLEKELSSVRESVGNLEGEKQKLSEQLLMVESERQQQSGQLQEKDETIADLQRQLQAKRDSEQRLMEKLEKERAQNHDLAAAKTDEEARLALLNEQLADLHKENEKQSRDVEALTSENSDLKRQLQIKSSQVDDLTQLASARGEEKEQTSAELERVTKELLDTRSKMADQIEQVSAYETVIENLQAEKERAVEAECALTEKVAKLRQDLSVAHENIAELAGAGPGAFVAERPVNQPEPPTAPAAPAGMVDQTVYESLLEAFENVQKYYADSQKENEKVVGILKEKQEKMVADQIKIDELLARIELCKDQYEELYKENHELKRKGGVATGGNQRRLEELEKEYEEVLRSCETAAADLAARKEELKQRDARICDLEQTLAKTENDFEQFQDKHDQEVQRRTEALDIQKAELDKKNEEVGSLQREKTKLERAVEQLKGQLGGLKDAAKGSTSRQCPVCDMVFPARMIQQDFENHVQGHFAHQ